MSKRVLHADGRVFNDFLGFISGLGDGEEAALGEDGGGGQMDNSATMESPEGAAEAQDERPKVSPSLP